MPTEAFLSAIAEAVFSYLLQQTDLADRVRAVLGVDPERKAFQTALARAYAAFARQYPDLTASLFDESFLKTEATAILAQLLTRRGHPDPADLARRWAVHLGYRDPDTAPRLAEVTRAAADFLRSLEGELAEKRVLWPIWDSRALERIAADAGAIRAALEPDFKQALAQARNVHIGGSVEEAIIVTGDNNIIYVQPTQPFSPEDPGLSGRSPVNPPLPEPKDVRHEIDELRRRLLAEADTARPELQREKERWESELQELLGRLRKEKGNNWSGLDLSHLRVKGQDFQETLLQGAYAWDTTFEACKFRHAFGSVSALAVSPDGKLLATGDNSGRILFWQSPNFNQPYFNTAGTGHSSTVRSLKFVHLDDGHEPYLLSAGDDGRVYRWDITAQGPSAPKLIRDVTVSAEETDEKGRKGGTKATKALSQKRALCATTSPDGRWVLIGDEEGLLHYVRVRPNGIPIKKHPPIPLYHKEVNGKQVGYWVVAVEFLVHDGNLGAPWTLVTGAQEGILNVWQVEVMGDELRLSPVWEGSLSPSRLRAIVADPEGGFFLTADEDSKIAAFAVQRSDSSASTPLIRQGYVLDPGQDQKWGRVWSLAVCRDRRFLAAGADDGVLRIWQWESWTQAKSERPKLRATGRKHTDRIWSVAFLNSSQIVTGGDDQRLIWWKLPADREPTGPTREQTDQGHPDTRLAEQKPKVENITADRSVQGYSNRIWTVATFSSNEADLQDLLAYAGDFVEVSANAGKDQKLRFLRLGLYDRKQRLAVLDYPLEEIQGRIEAIASHPEKGTLALAGHDGSIVLLQPRSVRSQPGGIQVRPQKQVIRARSSWVYAVAWHPDNNWLAYGTQGGQVWLHVEDDGKNSHECSLAFDQHSPSSKPVRAVAFSPDGKILAAASEDGQIRCWQHREGENDYEQLVAVDINEGGEPHPIRALAFHSSGQDSKYVLVSGDDSKAIRLWQVDVNEKSLTQIAEYRATPQESATGKPSDPLYHTDRIRALAFQPGGPLLASGDDDGHVIIWRYIEQGGKPSLTSLGVLRPRNQGKQARNQDQVGGEPPRTHASRVRSLSFFADGDLATCCEAETDSVIIWRYRYKDGTPPDTITRASALFDFDRSRVFYAKRPYERFDFSGATFEGQDEGDIEARLKHLGGIQSEIDEEKRQITEAKTREIRAAIQKAVGALYETSAPLERASVIRKAMHEYLDKAMKQEFQIGSPDALADWWHRLDDYENRLRILLDEGRETFYLVRGKWEEEEVARFLVRLCFILRRGAEGAGLALQEDLEEILLGGNDGFWSSPHYYSWPFVWAAVSPGKLQDLPDKWRGKFGKYVSLGFLAENPPLEMPSRAPDYREFFDGEEITFLADPDKPSEKLPIACTILDGHVRSDLKTLIWDYRSEEFEFSDEKLKELQKTFQQILTEILAQQGRVFEDNEMARLFAVDRNTWCFQPVRYSCYCVTNLPISFGMTAVEKQKSMLDWLCPLDEQTGRRKLPELSNCQLGNHLGVDCIVITRDGYLLMYRRLPDELTDPNMVGFVPSIAMRYYVQEVALSLEEVRKFCATITHDGQERQVHTPISAIIAGLHRELGVTLENIHSSLNISSPLLYLGTFREWARGGKPEMYFLTRSSLSWQEHFDKLPLEGKKEQYAPRKKDLQQGEEYRLWGNASPPRFDPTEVRCRLWRLVKTHERTLQESAKAGIYLLARACEEAPHVLEDFFKQFEVKP